MILFGVGSAGATPGDLDSTFGTGGKVLTNLGGGDEEVLALLPQPAGKLLAAGYTDHTQDGKSDFALIRYLSNGTLDSSFGTGGIVSIAFGAGPQDYEMAFTVVRTPGQKLVVGGNSGTKFAVARLLLNGQLDTSFSGDGRTTTAFGSSSAGISSLRVLPGGKIVAAGSSSGDFALVRYTAAGALDSSFGSGGKVVTSIGPGTDAGNALLRQPDGKLVVAGTTWDADGTNADFAIVRYLPNGALDPSFGNGGKVTTSFGTRDLGWDAALQPDGKIVLGGESDGTMFALARYTPSGALDPSFGNGGKVTTSFGGDLARATGVAIDPTGRIVAAGTLFSSTKFFLVARYTAAGQLDTSFTPSGVVRTSFGAGVTEGMALALQPGLIVVAGHHGPQLHQSDWALARFQGGTAAPPPPPTTTTTTAAKPAFSIADVRVTEGTRTDSAAVLVARLSSPAGKRGARVHYATRDGTAVARADYVAKSGTLELAKGETAARITVPIVSDATHEGDEQFTVRLSDPDNATIDDGKATVTILDDD